MSNDDRDAWKHRAIYEEARAQRVEHRLIGLDPSERFRTAHRCSEACELVDTNGGSTVLASGST